MLTGSSRQCGAPRTAPSDQSDTPDSGPHAGPDKLAAIHHWCVAAPEGSADILLQLVMILHLSMHLSTRQVP